MASRTDRILDELLDDWTHEGRQVTADIRERFQRLANMAEQVVLSGGAPVAVEAYKDLVQLEMASGALAAERSAREAFNRTAIRAIRWVVAVVA